MRKKEVADVSKSVLLIIPPKVLVPFLYNVDKNEYNLLDGDKKLAENFAITAF